VGFDDTLERAESANGASFAAVWSLRINFPVAATTILQSVGVFLSLAP